MKNENPWYYYTRHWSCKNENEKIWYYYTRHWSWCRTWNRVARAIKLWRFTSTISNNGKLKRCVIMNIWYNYRFLLVARLCKRNPNVEIIIKEKWRKLRLKTTVWKIFEEWQYLHFLSQGFEKQIFLKLELFEVIL